MRLRQFQTAHGRFTWLVTPADWFLNSGSQNLLLPWDSLLCCSRLSFDGVSAEREARCRKSSQREMQNRGAMTTGSERENPLAAGKRSTFELFYRRPAWRDTGRMSLNLRTGSRVNRAWPNLAEKQSVQTEMHSVLTLFVSGNGKQSVDEINAGA